MTPDFIEYVRSIILETGADRIIIPDYEDVGDVGVDVVFISAGELYDARVIEFCIGVTCVARAKLP